MERSEFKERLDALMTEGVESGLITKSTFAGPSAYRCTNCLNCNGHDFIWYFSLQDKPIKREES